ncbi:TIGR04086 family membrane protein [Murimonas intestini]|uniref:Membrane protein (TIGR04086 family) n=1 Tax=Murimonas intestini TaxID=1337051 RepID=A0AB73SZZ6_9FIRM|nr:TIGR04086 family membrane protein [Murimonas intestini]MCR1843203.1 TIGR04086 family membrane protein [Murimonas intestini]MCR1868568.1 TIGR04086 family membrane protein [Murimonas intestini]MCR1885137.1 TIGR04086 family membrane protein [Murimonas intestini]
MENSIWKKSKVMVVLKSLMISYVVTGILLLILAALLFKLELDEGKVTIGIIAVYIISSFLGGWIAGKGVESRKFMWGLIVGCAYFVMLTIISLLANQSLQAEPWQLITTFLMCMGGGMLGGMLA